MNKSTKPVRTPDAKEQILRAIAMKRESFFQLILANLLQNEMVTRTNYLVNQDGKAEKQPFDVNDVVDIALRGADHAIELLYPINAEAKDE